jgi:trehalose 6-phosphate phosphatase
VDPLLQSGSTNGSDCCRQPDEECVPEMHVPTERVRDRSDERDDSDRGQGGRHRRPLRELIDEDQERHDDEPATDAEERAEEAGDQADENEPHGRIVRTVTGDQLLGRLAEAPELAAILLDVDGTLAPIVARPEDARVPDDARAELARLAGRYGLVACISGRTGEDAHRLVQVEGVRYVGTHGLELEPEAERWRKPMHEFAASVDWPVEDKGLSVSFHYRQAEDEEAAARYLEEIAERARAAGLVPRFGRKVLELRPPVPADKGTAVAHLLAETGLGRALYAGDDTTDLDAFGALDGLELGIRVAVSSEEAPPQLADSADIVVGSPAELLGVLRLL